MATKNRNLSEKDIKKIKELREDICASSYKYGEEYTRKGKCIELQEILERKNQKRNFPPCQNISREKVNNKDKGKEKSRL